MFTVKAYYRVDGQISRGLADGYHSIFSGQDLQGCPVIAG